MKVHVGKVHVKQIYEIAKLKKARDPSMEHMSLEGISKCSLKCRQAGD